MTEKQLLKDQMKTLEQLQEVDLKIDHLKKKKTQLPTTLKALQENCQKYKASLAAKKLLLEETEKTLRQTQAALDLNNDRLNRSSSKLDLVHNTQEYQAATKEIEQLKKLNLSFDEQLGKSKQELDVAKIELDQIEIELLALEKDLESKANVVSGEAGQLDQEINLLLSERAKHTPLIEKRVLLQYDRIRAARAGLGLVPVANGRCSGCNMMLPPQLYNEIQKAQNIHVCPCCHRMLFIPTPVMATPPNNESVQTH